MCNEQIYDRTTCYTEAQEAYSDGSSPHKSMVSDDAEELYGDSIDEDSQSVKLPRDTAPAPSTSGRNTNCVTCGECINPLRHTDQDETAMATQKHKGFGDQN